MPINLPISTYADEELGRRVPSHKVAVDGTDVAGMVRVPLDALRKMEVLIREMQVQIAGLERRVR